MTGTAEPRCAACGSLLFEGDCFCEHCGARQGDARERGATDRSEVDLAVVAAISDRGRVHRRNDDAFRVEVVAEHSVAAVVCDGISSASAGDVAARAASEAAAAVLAAAAGDRTRDAQRATFDAVAAAHDAVAQVRWTTRTDRVLPSCTLVCALWRGDEIVSGSLGDSRAYWSEADGTRQLTVDDSWAEEQVADGLMSLDQALRDPRSHSITHWVGADAPPRPPRVVSVRPGRPGRLLLCTDGLWNYVTTASAMQHMIDSLPPGTSPAALARALTDTALARGGRDNITVAVVDVDPSSGDRDDRLHR